MDDNTNTPKLFSIPGCNKYRLSVAELKLLAQTSEFELSNSFSPQRKNRDESGCREPLLTRLDNDEEDGDPPGLFSPILCPEIEDYESTDETGLEGDTSNHTTEDNTENMTNFLSPNNVPEPNDIDQDADISALSDKGEWLRWHYRLGHLFYPKMKILILLGWLPRTILRVRPPMCACCKLGSMTKRP